jgi:hypothetical protein
MRGKKIWGTASIAGLGFVAGAVFADDTSMKSDQPVTDSYITTKVKAELANLARRERPDHQGPVVVED